MAGFHKGFADEQKLNKKIAQDVYMPKAPSERELARLAVTEGECVHKRTRRNFKASQAPSTANAVPLPLGGRLLTTTRLRVAGNNCMAGRPIHGALVRSQ